MPPKILIVEDNRKLAALFAEALAGRFETEVAGTLREGARRLDRCDALLLDLQLPDGDGLSLIPEARRRRPGLPIIVATAYGTVQKAVEALRLGAQDFLEKPVDLTALARRFADALAPGPGGIVAESPAMRRAMELAGRVAGTAFPVLILGETGTGKEVIARHIHTRSGRAPLVTLNCASLPSELAESLLFGHVRGAFTGAVEAKEGLVAAARGGTLFLDEIGDLPLPLQPKLLRFLDEGTFLPLGSTEARTSDARVIAATNKDLRREAAEGRFREDLLFRLMAFPLELEPLRRRPEDILPLARHRLAHLRQSLGTPVELADEAADLLRTYTYPGNVRELFNLLDRAALLSGGRIQADDLLPLMEAPPAAPPEAGEGLRAAGEAERERRERELILEALRASGGNKAAAARALKVSYKTLLNKMKRLGLSEAPPAGTGPRRTTATDG
ncbi:sigma-54-dependent Fis family transcriptional regulator [Dissulfurirhabdus thermomarina]|uniref:Sigma-54-dependent Fis family transcriptional regulator n=1 Tax=Dissulfurirhabdus thermomarina TaxID=1765737 RepID=A0A6N9TRU5_DISTH|nr:sigma-54 dependent transcriptional regulator [Dissulfurirhabdus thermomarina]NDY42833.1 sigma-54-dependent Fis family transcriptional regulator [Dissulfurirhabdus thermomarina]NMX23628.1 sigma-54-dependent Fis family transcriptional regulator [Dissulfurirhabdus thermomarina]